MFGVSLLMFSCHLEAVSIEQDMASREAFDGMLLWSFVLLAFLFLGTCLLPPLACCRRLPAATTCLLPPRSLSSRLYVSRDCQALAC
jgi:hypothetical protein